MGPIVRGGAVPTLPRGTATKVPEPWVRIAISTTGVSSRYCYAPTHASTPAPSQTLKLAYYLWQKGIEMEAAGVMDDECCLVIHGIANHADSHENGLWENCAAGTAAAFA